MATKHPSQQTRVARTVYRIFARTPYGHKLEKAARYERFRPKGYSVCYWERLLGSDVNNLHHMSKSISVARWFVRNENALHPGKFSKREALLLRVTGAMHDQAEAVIGDIPHGKKTPEERINEVEILRKYETRFEPGLKQPSLAAYRIGRDEIAFSDTRQKLAGAFHTIELIGFLQNALFALRRLNEITCEPKNSKKRKRFGIHNDERLALVTTALTRLSTEVLGSGIIERLIYAGHHYPSAHNYLLNHADEISTGINAVREETFAWYDSGDDPYAKPGEATRRLKKFHAQKRVWESWLKEQAS